MVDVGGGLRDIYGAGVLDRFMDEGVRVDACIGVSAGSANCASFTAGQRGRNKQFYLEYLLRKEAIGAGVFLKTGSVLDLSYVYGTLCAADGENPLNYAAITASDTALTVVATNAETGKPVYFDKHRDMAQNDYRILMASSCLPVFCKPIHMNGGVYYDGGLSDPLPYQRLLDDGCDRTVIILTKPLNAELNQNRNALGAKLLKRRYPAFSKVMNAASATYYRQLGEALKLQDEGRALILAPDDIMGLGTLSRDRTRLEALYEKGFRDAEKALPFLAK